MSFMSMYIYDKAPIYTADCDTCGATMRCGCWGAMVERGNIREGQS